MSDERAAAIEAWRVRLNTLSPEHGDELLAFALSRPQYANTQEGWTITHGDYLNLIAEWLAMGRSPEFIRQLLGEVPTR